MSPLKHRKILLGVSSGIAAYKAAELIRLLRKEEAEVRVMMTPNAAAFVSSLTFSALSNHRVYSEMFDESLENSMPHIELAKWAEVIVIAPATANTLAELAHGLASNLLTTTCLATKAPIILAPAMNRIMWENPQVQKNKNILLEQGIKCCGPKEGEQACGDIGLGCMAEPEIIINDLRKYFINKTCLLGKRLLITAGPTQEPIDPVRFISNPSSGKMGYALAEAAKSMGAEVVLISGPTQLSVPEGIESISVMTAQEMLEAVLMHSENKDIFISTAAVSDYRLEKVEAEKIKKDAETLQLNLIKNPDILNIISLSKKIPYVVGFAAETSRLIEHAREKLTKKQLNMIIANRVGPNQGFGQDDNEVMVITPKLEITLPRDSKSGLAEKLLGMISEDFNSH